MWNRKEIFCTGLDLEKRASPCESIWSKCWLCTLSIWTESWGIKMEVVRQAYWGHKSNFWQKSEFWSKVSILSKSFNSNHKSQFCPKVPMLSQFWPNVPILPKVPIESQAMGLKWRLDECDRRIGAGGRHQPLASGFVQLRFCPEIWFGGRSAALLILFCFCYSCDTSSPLLETLQMLGLHVNRDGFAFKAGHKETAHIHALCKGCTLQNYIMHLQYISNGRRWEWHIMERGLEVETLERPWKLWNSARECGSSGSL